ncbi:MAG: dipeptide epimerase [Rhodothermales bacterium]|nr:dipeptide epimerase [Rhodothermales bacterium]
MTVRSVSIFTAELPFHAPFRISLSVMTGTTNLFVRLEASDGSVGWGEASPSPSITGDTAASMAAVAPRLARTLLGREVADLGGAHRAMLLEVPGNPTMRSAFDMALHDLAARKAGLPLFAFLGGARRVFQTDNTVSLDDPDTMAATARRFLKAGFRAIKAKVGTGASDDIARIRALREAIGPDIPLRVDANQGWDVPSAVRVLTETTECALEYCEQPVLRRDHAGLKAVREAVGVPVMADESVFDAEDALALARADACDYLNIKLSKSGGLWVGRQIATIGQAAGMACMVGCMSETRLGLSAAAHLMSALPIIRFADLDSHVDHVVDPVVGGIEIRDGRVYLPEGPGLGARPSEDFLASCPRQDIEA